MTPDLPRVASIGDDVIVDPDLTSVATEMVRALRLEGADIVVALTHIGKELDEVVAGEVAGIDIIIGGHSHDTFFEYVKGPGGWKTIVVQAGVNAMEPGILSFDVAGGRVTSPHWETVLLDETMASDEEIAAYLDGYKKKLKKKMEKPVGETLTDLDAISGNVRTSETNLGNLVADAWVDWFAKEGTSPIALINGGTIRGNRIVNKGPLTYGELLEILPFANTIYEVSLSGKDLLSVLEMSASAIRVEGDGCLEGERIADGGFLQISGVRIVIDLSGRPFCAEYDGRSIKRIIFPGERLISAEIMRDGKWVPVSGDETYTVLVTSWTASGGDGYAPFIAAEKIDTTVDTLDAFVTYIEEHIPVAPEIEGRIEIRE